MATSCAQPALQAPGKLARAGELACPQWPPRTAFICRVILRGLSVPEGYGLAAFLRSGCGQRVWIAQRTRRHPGRA